MRVFKNSLIIWYSLIMFFIVGCSGINFTDWRFPYMYPVQQGNYISAEGLAELKPGMTKDQVSFVIGHPVSQFMFDTRQWQYVYQQYDDNKLKNSYIVNINFDANDKLVTVESAGQVFTK